MMTLWDHRRLGHPIAARSSSCGAARPSQQSGNRTPASTHTRCAAQDKSLGLSEPLCAFLQGGDNNTCLPEEINCPKP